MIYTIGRPVCVQIPLKEEYTRLREHAQSYWKNWTHFPEILLSEYHKRDRVIVTALHSLRAAWMIMAPARATVRSSKSAPFRCVGVSALDERVRCVMESGAVEEEGCGWMAEEATWAVLAQDRAEDMSVEIPNPDPDSGM